MKAVILPVSNWHIQYPLAISTPVSRLVTFTIKPNPSLQKKIDRNKFQEILDPDSDTGGQIVS